MRRVKFILDAQLPPSLAQHLTLLDCEAIPVRNLGLREAEDETIWNYAESHGMVIMTKDEDFADRVIRLPAGPAIVWLRIGNCSNSALLQWLVPMLPTILDQLESGDRLVEVA